MFGYESTDCAGGILNDFVAVVGAAVVSHDVESDLLLLELNVAPPPEVAPYYLGFGYTGTPDEAVVIGQPCGGLKRIAIAEPYSIQKHTAIGRDFFEVQFWDEGALASGASGSPLMYPDGGYLVGLYTDRGGASPETSCGEPFNASQDRFTTWQPVVKPNTPRAPPRQRTPSPAPAPPPHSASAEAGPRPHPGTPRGRPRRRAAGVG